MAKVLYLAIYFSVLKRDCPSWRTFWRTSERKEAPAGMARASFYMT